MGSALDAHTLRRSMELFAGALGEHREELDSLNVFPVPDGDTGTNMLLTQRAVQAALAEGDPSEDRLPELATTIARASLRGAKGNSGVILSQVLRAMTEVLASEADAGGSGLAAALRHASVEADRAVARPVDGTILSVLRDAAGAAEDAATDGGDIASVVDAALEAARASLEATPNQLPDLHDACVVDAGAKGFVLLLASLRAAIDGTDLDEPVGPGGPVGRDDRSSGEPAGARLGFEVQFLLETREEAVRPLRASLDGIGDSAVVVGGGGIYTVHVHTQDPDGAIELGRAAGSISAVSTTDLAAAVADCIGARGVRALPGLTALVALADGAGLARTLRSLGAVVVDDAESVAAAVQGAGEMDVLVLANGQNLPEREGRVALVRTTSPPEILAAAAAFNADRSLQENAGAVSDAAGRVHSAPFDPDANDLGALADPTAELVTVVVGAGRSHEETGRVEADLREAFPAAEIHVVDGGQAEPPYWIGVE